MIKAIDDDYDADDTAARPLQSPPPPQTPSSADPSAIATSSAAFAAAMSLSAAAIKIGGGTNLDLAGSLLQLSGADKAAAAALLAAPLLGDAAAASSSPSSALAAHAGAAVAVAAIVTGVRAAAVAATGGGPKKSEEEEGEETLTSSPSSYSSEFDASLALVLPRLSTPEVLLWLCLLPSVAEEALFRSALLPLVSADWRGCSAVAVLFGVLHFSPRAGRGTASAAVAAGAGLLYGALYVWTGGDLVATAGGHAMVNAGSAALWWSRREEEERR